MRVARGILAESVWSAGIVLRRCGVVLGTSVSCGRHSGAASGSAVGLWQVKAMTCAVGCSVPSTQYSVLKTQDSGLRTVAMSHRVVETGPFRGAKGDSTGAKAGRKEFCTIVPPTRRKRYKSRWFARRKSLRGNAMFFPGLAFVYQIDAPGGTKCSCGVSVAAGSVG